MSKRVVGKSGEIYCAEWLKQQGYEILRQNFHCRYGEIDIIARDGHFLVFIEVKTRTFESIDHAMTSITYSKQKKLTKAAMYFVHIMESGDDGVSPLRDILEYRFDVVIVQKSPPLPPPDGAGGAGLVSPDGAGGAGLVSPDGAGGASYYFHHIKNAFPPAEVGEFFA